MRSSLILQDVAKCNNLDKHIYLMMERFKYKGDLIITNMLQLFQLKPQGWDRGNDLTAAEVTRRQTHDAEPEAKYLTA